MKTRRLRLSLALLGLASCLQAQTAQSQPADAAPAKPAAADRANAKTVRNSYSTNEFAFGGGSLRDFIQAVQNAFGVNLLEQATVPGQYLAQIRVPKIKLLPGSPPSIPLTSVLIIYNSLTENDVKGLGRWVTPAGSDTTVFVPPPPEQLDMTRRIRVFSFEAKTDEQRTKLNMALRSTLDFLYQAGDVRLDGQYRYNPETSLLIAVGDENYLNAVSQVIEALKEAKAAEKPKF